LDRLLEDRKQSGEHDGLVKIASGGRIKRLHSATLKSGLRPRQSSTRIALDRQTAHDPGMSEETDNLRKQIDELREDLKLLIRDSAHAQKDITAWADQSGKKELCPRRGQEMSIQPALQF
jgi:hypothetical protein